MDGRGTTRLEWRRGFASSKAERKRALMFLSAAVMTTSGFIGWFAKAWLVLPFAGIEVAVLILAFMWLERHADDADSVEIDGQEVKVFRNRRDQAQAASFNRDWVIVELAQGDADGDRGVRLRQSGRSIELLEFLPLPERRRALYELRHALAERRNKTG